MTTDIFEQEEKLEKMTDRPHGVTIVAILMIINGIILIAGAVFTIYFVPILVDQITDTFTGNKTVSFGLNLTDGNEISPQVVASITDTIITIAMITVCHRNFNRYCMFSIGMGLVHGKRLELGSYRNSRDYFYCLWSHGCWGRRFCEYYQHNN